MYKRSHLIAWITILCLVCIVPACLPNSPFAQPDLPLQSPGVEQVTGSLTVQDGMKFEYGILVPQSWKGKVEIREAGNIVYFDYMANHKSKLFSLAAFSEEQWQEIQKEPGSGVEIRSQDGFVVVYNLALDNPYTGNQAEEFQQMAGQVKKVISSLTISK